MAADKDKLQSPNGSQPVANAGEGASGERIKKQPAPAVKTLFAEFRTRSAGLSGADFERELDVLIEQVVERNLEAAPAGVRDELRETVRSYLENDPTFSKMVADLRAAARR
jgi:hypothetical protein